MARSSTETAEVTADGNVLGIGMTLRTGVGWKIYFFQCDPPHTASSIARLSSSRLTIAGHLRTAQSTGRALSPPGVSAKQFNEPIQ